MTERERQRLERIIETCAERVSGVYYIKKRKILVMINFLRENGYKYCQKTCLRIARDLGITSSAGTISGYIRRFDAEWEAERAWIEAAERARLNCAAEVDIKPVAPNSSEINVIDADSPKESAPILQEKRISCFEISEHDIKRFKELMSNVRDERDNRGKKYELIELLAYYVFHFLLVKKRVGTGEKFDDIYHKIMLTLEITQKPDNIQWVKDVIKNKINNDAFRRALLQWLSEFDIDTRYNLDDLAAVILDDRKDCDEMMRCLRMSINFSVAESLNAAVASDKEMA